MIKSKLIFLAAGILSLSALTHCGDPGISKERAPQIEGMIYLPGGSFGMGNLSGRSDARPKHEVKLSAFYIDQFEVTNAAYQEFVDATGHPAPWIDPQKYPWANEYNWTAGKYPAGTGDHPVVLVSWSDAVAFAKWKGKRLPTEAEWEKAASDGTSRIYPWGDEWDVTKCNSRESHLNAAVAVTAYENGSSPRGVRNLAGNVWEWCSDWYDKDYYQQSSVQDPVGADRGATKVIRGGSWDTYGVDRLTTFSRESQFPGTKSYDLGFRCAKDAEPSR